MNNIFDITGDIIYTYLDGFFCETCHKNKFIFLSNIEKNKKFFIDKYLCANCNHINIFSFERDLNYNSTPPDSFIPMPF